MCSPISVSSGKSNATSSRKTGGAHSLAPERGDWRLYYEGVADAILDGAPPPVDPADALAGLELIALARRSAAEGRTRAVG